MQFYLLQVNKESNVTVQNFQWSQFLVPEHIWRSFILTYPQLEPNPKFQQLVLCVCVRKTTGDRYRVKRLEIWIIRYSPYSVQTTTRNLSLNLGQGSFFDISISHVVPELRWSKDTKNLEHYYLPQNQKNNGGLL